MTLTLRIYLKLVSCFQMHRSLKFGGKKKRILLTLHMFLKLVSCFHMQAGLLLSHACLLLVSLPLQWSLKFGKKLTHFVTIHFIMENSTAWLVFLFCNSDVVWMRVHSSPW